jgi:rod shape-determining protein MreC
LQEKYVGWRLLVVLALCLSALFVFRENPRIAPLRTILIDATATVYEIAVAPREAWRGLTNYFQSRRALQEENARLRQENLVMQGQTQRLVSVLAENSRYRALLNSSELIEGDVIVAEIISVSADPVRHLLVLDKGSDQGVANGQALLGAAGLMGQVVTTGATTSRAMLITDSTHAVPVQVVRSGVRALVAGVGDIDQLIVRHLAATTDIRIGDVLVTSGLGGRFPPGYPVAKVTDIYIAPGAAFATVTAVPLAHLDRGRHVLIAQYAAADATVTP